MVVNSLRLLSSWKGSSVIIVVSNVSVIIELKLLSTDNAELIHLLGHRDPENQTKLHTLRIENEKMRKKRVNEARNIGKNRGRLACLTLGLNKEKCV